MKVSEITNKDIALYLGLDYDSLTSAELSELDTLLGVAKGFVKSYTGLTVAEVDAHEEFNIVIYILVEDMYDNRTMYVEKSNLNKVVTTILGMHCINLI